jgi:hypothetical protein
MNLFGLIALTLALSTGAGGANEKGKEMTSVHNADLVWGRSVQSDDRSYLFTFDPVMGLMDLDGRQVGIDGWKFLAAPDDQTSAYLKVDRGVTLEQVYRAIARLEDEGGFRSVVVTFDIPKAKK